MLLKYSDAVHCFANFESPDPFLFTIIKANNPEIFKECITDWADLVKKQEPHNAGYFDLTQANHLGENVLHLLAQTQSIEALEMISIVLDLSEKRKFEKTTVLELLNDPVSEDQPHTTPLFYTYPNVEIFD